MMGNESNSKDKFFILKFRGAEIDLRRFLTYSCTFSAFMTVVHGWKVATIEGIFFGAAMTLIHSFASKRSQAKREIGIDDDFEISTSKPLSYLLIFGFWFFAAFGAMSLLSKEGSPGLAVTFFSFALFELWCALSASTQVIVGSSTIVRRTHMPFVSPLEKFELSKAVSLQITWYKGIRISFSDGRRISVYPSFQMHLKPYEGVVPNPQLENLYRLKQELEKRTEAAKTRNESTSIEISNFKHNPPGIKAFFLIGSLVTLLILSISYSIQNQAMRKLTTTPDQKQLLYSDFENAFFLYRGEDFLTLKNSYLEKCRTNADSNCRLASYIKKIQGDHNAALALLRTSCSDKDPHSCYNILISKGADHNDKTHAEVILSDVCKNSPQANAVCCDCYRKLKNQAKD